MVGSDFLRVKISESKNSKSFYIIKSVRINGKSTSKIVEKLGTLEEVTLKANGQDPYEWAKARAKELTKQAAKKEPDILVKFSPNKQIKPNQESLFNGGYLFLQQLYYQLGLHKICEKISKTYKFEFDLNAILSQLVYSRILYPGSKLQAFHTIDKYIERPNVSLHQFYRALEVISKENDFIQSQLYKNSQDVIQRNSKILYYDCTNFSLKLSKKMAFGNMDIPKKNVPTQLFRWGYLWTETESPSLLILRQEIRMNKPHSNH